MHTVWHAMSRPSQDLTLASAIKYAILVVFYGAYELFRLGPLVIHYIYTYLPVIGGLFLIVASLGACALANSCDTNGTFSLVAGLVILAYYPISLYEIGPLGAIKIIQAVNPINIIEILEGIFWIVVACRLNRKLWIIQKLMSTPDDREGRGLALLSELKIKPSELRHLKLDGHMGSTPR